MEPSTSREAATAGWSRRLAGLAGPAVALLFLLAGLATLDDRGLTWDEPESIYAGVQNLEILRVAATGDGEIEWPWHELRGYQFLVDTVRVGFAGAVAPLVGGPEVAEVPIRGVHLFHLLLATVSLLLVDRIVVDVSGSPRLGGLASLVLALSPKYVAHSQNNPKDLVALFSYALFLWALERALAASERTSRVRLGAFAAAGALLGFAFASHVLSALLVPVAVAWVLLRLPRRPGRRWRDPFLALAVTGAASAATAFALWPWLWAEPLVRTGRVVRRVLTFSLPIDVLYLGRAYPWADPPFHYFTVHLLVGTPAVLLAAAILGAWAGLRRSTPPKLRRLVLLAGLWAGIPMVTEAFTGARYDGLRHLLVVLPAVAILAGVGLDRLLTAATAEPVRRRRAARAALGFVVAGLLWLAVDLARYHPYQDAYLNVATRATLDLLERPPEEVFELEYWGSTYKEGAEWLNAHAGGGTVIHAPLARWCAEPYLDADFYIEGRRWRFAPPRQDDRSAPEGYDGPRYLMIMTRVAFLPPDFQAFRREHEPVHTIDRLGATLLEIYRLPPPTSPGLPPSRGGVPFP